MPAELSRFVEQPGRRQPAEMEVDHGCLLPVVLPRPLQGNLMVATIPQVGFLSVSESAAAGL
jgi:hypothetical protein